MVAPSAVVGKRLLLGESKDQFRLTDERLVKLVLRLPNDALGKGCVDDRRVIRGIVLVLSFRGRSAAAGRVIHEPTRAFPKRSVRGQPGEMGRIV